MRRNFPSLPETDELHRLHREAASVLRDGLNAETRQAAQARAYLRTRGLDAKDVVRFGLGFAGRYHDTFGEIHSNLWTLIRDRVTFEIRDAAGRVCGFSGRKIDPEAPGPKYRNSSNSQIFLKSICLYGLDLAIDEIRRRGYAIIVEGQIDTIQMHRAGFTNTIAPLGTSFTESHAFVLRRYTDEAVLLFDNDPRTDPEKNVETNPGRRAAERAGELLRSLDMRPADCVLPQGCDPDAFLKDRGARALERLIETALHES